MHQLIESFTFLPKQTEYSFYSYKFEEAKIYDNIMYEEVIDLDWLNKRITSINIKPTLSPQEYKLIHHILLSTKMNGWIEFMSLTFRNLSELLAIFDLCSDCFNIKILKLSYSDLKYFSIYSIK